MFAELKCKSNFSFLRGSSHPEEIMEQAMILEYPAIALTDLNGVYGIPKAYWKSKDQSAVKLITGVELTIENHPNITVIVQDRSAYGLLCRMITASHANKEKGKAFLTFDEFKEFANDDRSHGWVCIASQGSDFSFLKSIFLKRLFVSVSKFLDGHDTSRVNQSVELSKKWNVELVATNDVLYHSPERRAMQDALTCIRETTSLTKAGYLLHSNGERYLKHPMDMVTLFKDLPNAITTTLRIAEACTFSPSELRYQYPSEWIPSHHTAQSYLEELTWIGAKERYKIVPDKITKQIQHELRLIEQMKYADYFLTIYDIVAFARSKDILCQGRGSAANSVVCYCLGVTAVDPNRMDLLFERFISAERDEPPDIDVDFEHERREEVIQYIYAKYGRDRAAMVSAVVTYKKPSAIREIAKIYDVPVGTLSAKKLLRDFPNLAKESPIQDCKEQIVRLSTLMHGFPRHISIHSGGFTLSATPITEIVPVEPARMEGRTIVQWDKYDLDYLGLLKVDILALGMLTAMKKNLDMVGMKLHEIPAEDKKTYEMIQKADTVGTFQIESRAQMNMTGRLMPRQFYDLVVQIAIVRPGPIVGKMVHPYLRRRQGKEAVDYPHPKLKEILHKTLGVPIFQEQLMRIAIELGDFSPGEADQLRRAIGAWRSSGSIQKVGQKLVERLQKNGISEEFSHRLLEQMKGFAAYGFPESHAASFALIAYASCYLKCHYPAEFACSMMNSQPLGFYNSHSLLDDAKRHGTRTFNLNINRSNWDHTIEHGAIRIGFRSVKGLSKEDAEFMIFHRPYTSLPDFLAKNKTRNDVLERLAIGDAFLDFGEDRRHTLWKILSDRIRQESQQLHLFSGYTMDVSNDRPFDPMTPYETIKSDYDAYQMSANGHPMQGLRSLYRLPKTTTRDAKNSPPKTFVKTSGLLLVRQKPPTANGVCFGAIEDEYGFLDLVLFQESFEKNKEAFLYNCFMIVSGYIERDGHSVSMIVKKVEGVWKNMLPESQLVIEPTQYFY